MGRDLIYMAVQDFDFRARHVVLVEFANAVEELGAPLVIKILAGQGLRAGCQPAEDLGAHIAPGGVEIVEGD
jgi:hypothetical protein